MLKYSKVVLCLCIFSGGLSLIWIGYSVEGIFKNHSWTREVTEEDPFLSTYFSVDGPASVPRWTNATSNVYVFSAYLDSRQGANKTVINIFGVLMQKPQLRVKFFCLLEDHAAHEIAFTPARIDIGVVRSPVNLLHHDITTSFKFRVFLECTKTD